RGAGPHVQDAGPGCSASAQRETVMTAIRQILCATDLSPASEPACEEALRLARAWQAELLLLHVIPPVVFPAEGIFPPRLYRTLVDAVHREAHAGMDRLLERVPDPMLKVRMRIQEGVPAAGILDAVGEEAIDLIVMGTHGRAGPQRLLLGSVADRVVRQASCPVMTVRAGMAPRGPPPLLRDRLLADGARRLALGRRAGRGDRRIRGPDARDAAAGGRPPPAAGRDRRDGAPAPRRRPASGRAVPGRDRLPA